MITDSAPPRLRVGVLGPLQLEVDGDPVDVPGDRRRALLALLALSGGRAVGIDRLIDALWPEDPPDGAVQALYNHVSRLRRHLGAAADRLERYGAGYVLHLEPDELDVEVARRLATEAKAHAHQPQEAVALARSALDLWRGQALEEFAEIPPLAVESVALTELHLQLHDELVEARIRAGDRSVTAEAAQAAMAQPLRERSTLLHMRALAAEGRSAEAMSVGTAYRRLLVEETGLDPGPELGRLEQQIATGTLDTPAESALASVGHRTVVAPSGPLVGRQQERDEILRLLGSHPVLTVTGPGGVGKTRLALDIAAESSHGGSNAVVVVHLAAVDDPGRVFQAVASTLGLRTAGDVTPYDVARAVSDQDLLLVLDNCEHVLEACRELVVAVRSTAPGVRVLATSRATLHVPGEFVIRLQPLPVPHGPVELSTLERQPSARAFIEHARRRRHGFALEPSDVEPLVEILRALDGLPLAIELAAGHVSLMPVAAVRERLGRALDLTNGRQGDEDERQRTLRLTIDWSYRLLTPDEQALLRALAVFPGGTDLVTVEEIAADVVPGADPLEILQRLVDASLVVVDSTMTRYRLLFTVRTFLIERLSSLGESDSAERRLLDWAKQTAQQIGEGLVSAEESTADRRLRAELDNLRAARDLARGAGDLDTCIDITLGFDQSSIWRDLRELWSWCLELADDPAIVGHPREIEVVGSASEGARIVGAFDRSLEYSSRGLAIAVPPEDAARLQARCWSSIAAVSHYRGDFERARDCWARSAVPSSPWSSGHLLSAALAAGYGGHPDLAQALLEEGRAAEARHPCPTHRAFAYYVEGEITAVADPRAAIPCYLTAIDLAQVTGANFVEGVASVALASARTRTGDVGAAAAGFAHLLDYWHTTGHQTQLWTTARNAAQLLAREGRGKAAALLLLRADTTPGAAAVDQDIARHSGRMFLTPADVVSPEEIDALRRDAGQMSSRAVIDEALAELTRIAAAQAH